MSTIFIFLQSKDGIMKDFYDNRYSTVDSFQEGVDKITADPNYVFIGWESLSAMEAVGECHLQSVHYNDNYLVFYARKNFPYLDIINHQ